MFGCFCEMKQNIKLTKKGSPHDRKKTPSKLSVTDSSQSVSRCWLTSYFKCLYFPLLFYLAATLPVLQFLQDDFYLNLVKIM
jgi:hypothetical protein